MKKLTVTLWVEVVLAAVIVGVFLWPTPKAAPTRVAPTVAQKAETAASLVPSVTPPAPCNPGIDAAIRERLDARLETYNEAVIWMSDDYSEKTWKPKLDAEEREILRIRPWSTLQEPCVATAYDRYLSYYEDGIGEAWRELRTHDMKDRQDAYNKKWAADAVALRQYEREHGAIPTPPANDGREQ